jgi:predicted Zn finger-like uncharacterized protein
MSVRCEHCKTEYDFDEDRIGEAGVAVTCTTCGHVFAVRKNTMATGPVKKSALENGTALRESPPLAGLPDASAVFEFAPPKPKEWKVRQANNRDTLTFKELATLQRWIIEGKVSRLDEISLTGESWKRLGNIAELAAFFKVVDEAKRGVEQPPPAPGAPERPPRAPQPRIERTPVEWSTDHSERTPPIAGPSAASDFDSFSFPKESPGSDVPSIPPPPVSPMQPPPFKNRVPGDPVFAQTEMPRKAFRENGVKAAAGLTRRPTRPTRAALVLLGVVLVGYLVYYFWVFLPERQSRSRIEAAVAADLAQKAEQQRLARERAEAERTTPSGTLNPDRAKPKAGGASQPTEPPKVAAGAGSGRTEPGGITAGAGSGRTEPGGITAGAGSGRTEPGKVTAGAGNERTEPGKVTGGTGGGRTEPGRLIGGAGSERTEPPKMGNERTDPSKLTGVADAEQTPQAKVPAPDGMEGEEPTKPQGLPKSPVPVPESGSRERSRAAPRPTFDSLILEADRLREREHPVAALRAYAKAAELEPDRAEPLAGRGLALMDLGRTGEAEKTLQQALRLNPNYTVALMGLAEAYRAQGKKTEALRYYQRYLEVLPNGPEASIARSAIRALQE